MLTLFNLLYNYNMVCVCVCVCPSFTYLLIISFSLTSFRFHYLSGVIPLAPVPCGVFWGLGEGKAWWSTRRGGLAGGGSTGGGGQQEGPARAGGWGHGRGRAGEGRGGEAGQGRGGPASNQTKIQFKKIIIFIIEHIKKTIIFLKRKKKNK
jgi:hypothetical protein